MALLKEQVSTLAKKEMDRKDFLKYGGSVLLAAIGVTGLLRVLLSAHQQSTPSSSTSDQADNGYGKSAYGR